MITDRRGPSADAPLCERESAADIAQVIEPTTPRPRRAHVRVGVWSAFGRTGGEQRSVLRR